jgi:hypothetical protein
MAKGVRVSAAIGFSVAALAIAGCGDTVIDNGKAEDAIRADVEKSLKVPVKSVECPSDVKVEAGKTFECIVTAANGKKATATLKILNSDADVSFVDFQPIK